jgi:hypothetical protein
MKLMKIAVPSLSHSVSHRQTVQLSLWVKPPVKAEVQRIAQTEQVSVSKVGGTFLEEALRQRLSTQHAILLQPIVEQAISKRMNMLSTRLSSLLIQGLLDVGQIRRLVINILARQPGMTEQILDEIIDGSKAGARRQLTQKNPQLTAFIAEVAAWLAGQEEI